ncbi:MAG: hypothetical protein JKY49_06680 [Cohaesibacteraceae bacterium]|nr:hypothetical protein [Cohaesibacteraceae bacterium]MBL4877049.1 hypothetical protein [Cohaesibacteraceae bacterium]
MTGTKTALQSKINWTQIIGIGVSLGAIFGLDIDAETQKILIAAAVGLQGLVTIIFRIWFTSKQIA